MHLGAVDPNYPDTQATSTVVYDIDGVAIHYTQNACCRGDVGVSVRG